ncbi:MAG: HAMP domain-containing methyl-accepting chemotaxis protein [Thermodesulfobacteriota bacterium]
MIFQGLKAKILTLTVGIIVLSFGVMVLLVIKDEEKILLKERRRAVELMAEPILHTIYKDMLEERADMPRFLIAGLKTIKDVERVQLIRSNGVEEAFQDYKTLKAVKEEFGELKPEWIVDHPNKATNVAEGIWSPEFKAALLKFNEGHKDSIYYIEEADGKSLFTYLVPIEFRQKCSSCHAEEEEARGILMISTSLDEMYGALSGSRNKWIIFGAVTVVIVVTVLGFLIRAIITAPVDRTVVMLKAISEGKGDLTRRLDITSKDEIGMLGAWFNNFVEGMQVMVKGIFAVSSEVSAASKKVEKSSQDILTSVQKQLKAADETAGSIEEMDVSIKSVAEDAEALNISSKKVSASAKAMNASTEEVKSHNEKLFISATSTAASINEIAVSINEVASHVDTLFEKTGEVVNSIMQIGGKVKEVEKYSAEQAELAERVRADAEDIGMASVVKVGEGIERVNKEMAGTQAVINRLGERSKEIGNILIVINEFADTTHLLALNATILAAQAGEHGKGFAVVARQVKELASKTTNSTKEISELINQVQNEVSVAVESMDNSSKQVEEGVRLSRDAEQGLSKILESAKLSLDKAKLIENSTTEQASGLEHVTDAAKMISEMVGEIKRAADGQSIAAKEILKDTVQMREFMEKVKASTGVQSVESKQVSEAIFRVAEKIVRVAETTSEQMMLSERMVSAMVTVKKVAEDNATLAFGLDKTVREMNKLSDSLRSNVGNFKT